MQGFATKLNSLDLISNSRRDLTPQAVLWPSHMYLGGLSVCHLNRGTETRTLKSWSECGLAVLTILPSVSLSCKVVCQTVRGCLISSSGAGASSCLHQPSALFFSQRKTVRGNLTTIFRSCQGSYTGGQKGALQGAVQWAAPALAVGPTEEKFSLGHL